MPRSTVTIRDVAKYAGVSHQTVSRVINRFERVSPETRKRVEEAIKVLGYRPNAVARSMARGRTCMLGCFSPNLTDYTFASIIEAAEQEFREHGYFLVSSSAPDEEAFSILVDQLVSTRRVEGLVVINPHIDYRYKHVPTDLPVVYIGSQPQRDEIHSVCLDENAAARDAMQHLLDLGHRRIAMITGPMMEDCSQLRFEGYLHALEFNGIPFNPELIQHGDWSATTGYQSMQKILGNHRPGKKLPITAVFAQNDRMAIGAIKAITELGLHVPDDVSIIGVDDMPLASYFEPALTTMGQDLETIGKQAARLLVQALELEHMNSKRLLVPANLIIRKSTGPVSLS